MTVQRPCEACEGSGYGPNCEHCSACDATGWERPKIKSERSPYERTVQALGSGHPVPNEPRDRGQMDAFEEWATANSLDTTRSRCAEFSYDMLDTERAWEAWKAGLRIGGMAGFNLATVAVLTVQMDRSTRACVRQVLDAAKLIVEKVT